MPKTKLKTQNSYEFEYKRTLQVKDINYGGHLGNDSLVTILHEARIDLLNKLGFTELNLGDNNTGIIMTDLIVNYLNEGLLLDEISVMSHINEKGIASFRIFHKILKNDKILALAETGIVSFDYKAKQISEVPEIFNVKLNNYLETVSKSMV